MKKNLLNDYVRDLLKSVEENLSTYLRDKASDCLHHLRVDIKKVKAVFYFAETIGKEKYDTTKLKPLFNKAGKIREIQINLNLLGMVPNPPQQLIEQLQKKENILNQQFLKCGWRYGRRIRKFRKKVSLPEILPNKKTINHYFQKEKKKANKNLKNIDREELHQYRAKIKRLLYAYHALPLGIQNKIELNEGEINRLQEELGDWHDTYSAINYLSDQHFGLTNAEFVIQFKEKEKRQFNALRSKLTHNRI
jgi:CHAD domain-containing protein